jgi:hypothetical protein
LEKENKDLNDYINLMNEKDKRSEDVKLTLNETDNDKFLKAEIERLEFDKSQLTNDLASIKANDNDQHQVDFDSIRLLEDKFNRVMKDNADLKEKNQELEHVVQQLQFETETIVDYISMYQMERLKLNDKYKIKDESIRSLSTQLQVNKLALHEINNYLNAFARLSQTKTQTLNQEEEEEEEETKTTQNLTGDSKRDYLLQQMQALINELTSKSSTTLNALSATTTSPFNSISSQKKLQNETQINPKSIADFRSQTFICSECYGDLFIV